MNFKHLAQLTAQYELILGSGSPRRVRLLTETGVKYRQVVPHLEEERDLHETPFAFARRLAEDKALWVAARTEAGQIVIGCDTVVVLGESVLGKPTDESNAFAILSALAGRQHTVCTALALAEDGLLLASGYELTSVFFNAVTPEQIRDYIATEEPMDKAGAYGIQGMGAFLVDRIDGNLDNVIGLPRKLLDELAGEILGNT